MIGQVYAVRDESLAVTSCVLHYARKCIKIQVAFHHKFFMAVRIIVPGHRSGSVEYSFLPVLIRIRCIDPIFHIFLIR